MKTLVCALAAVAFGAAVPLWVWWCEWRELRRLRREADALEQRCRDFIVQATEEVREAQRVIERARGLLPLTRRFEG